MGSKFCEFGMHVFMEGVLEKLGYHASALGVDFRTPLPSSMYFQILVLLQLKHLKGGVVKPFMQLINGYYSETVASGVISGMKAINDKKQIDMYRKKDVEKIKIKKIGTITGSKLQVPKNLRQFQNWIKGMGLITRAKVSDEKRNTAFLKASEVLGSNHRYQQLAASLDILEKLQKVKDDNYDVDFGFDSGEEVDYQDPNSEMQIEADENQTRYNLMVTLNDFYRNANTSFFLKIIAGFRKFDPSIVSAYSKAYKNVKVLEMQNLKIAHEELEEQTRLLDDRQSNHSITDQEINNA